MPKKIYDILPPKLANKVQDTILTLKKESPVQKTTGRPAKRKTKSVIEPIAKKPVPQKWPLKELLIGGGVIVTLLAVFAINKLPKAHITILPSTDSTELRETVAVSKSTNTINVQSKIIPARYLQEEKSSSEEFPATGTLSNDGKASGVITFYNKLDPATPFTLVKGTHLLSNSGKYFITTQKITIPAAKWQKGKLVAGFIAATVQAKEAGEEYNIGPSQFSIPKLSGTKYYYSISAESNENMKGGHIGQVKQITKDDIDQAEDILNNRLLAEAESSLRSALSQDEVLLDNMVTKNVVSAKSSASQGTIANAFTMQSQVKVAGLAIKKQDLDALAKNLISMQLPSQVSYLDNSLKVDYSVQALDISGMTATLQVSASAKIYKTVDTESLVNLVPRESADEINKTINQIYGDSIVGVKVDFWPFWVTKAPKNIKRIKIDLSF